MIVYDVAAKVLGTKKFPQHNIADLNSDITFIVFFQSGEAFTVKGNKHTHTPAAAWLLNEDVLFKLENVIEYVY